MKNTERFKMPYPKACDYSGSKLGRGDWTEHKDKPIKFHLARVKGYGCGAYWGVAYWGGAYWGALWRRPLFQAFGWAENKTGEEDMAQRMFVWAKTREDAKVEILKVFPLAKFYR